MQFTVGKKMAAVHFTSIPCEPNTAYKALRKPLKTSLNEEKVGRYAT